MTRYAGTPTLLSGHRQVEEAAVLGPPIHMALAAAGGAVRIRGHARAGAAVLLVVRGVGASGALRGLIACVCGRRLRSRRGVCGRLHPACVSVPCRPHCGEPTCDHNACRRPAGVPESTDICETELKRCQTHC